MQSIIQQCSAASCPSHLLWSQHNVEDVNVWCHVWQQTGRWAARSQRLCAPEACDCHCRLLRHIVRGANWSGRNFSPLRVSLEHSGATHSVGASPGHRRGAHVPGRPPVASPTVSAECGSLSHSRLSLEHTERHGSIYTAEYHAAYLSWGRYVFRHCVVIDSKTQTDVKDLKMWG